MSLRVGNHFFNWAGTKTSASSGSMLLALRNRVHSLFSGDFPVIPRPIPGWKLPKPKEPLVTSYQPPRLFYRGAIDRKAPRPIDYLLTETTEVPKARPVPGKSPLLRSLCKGSGTLKMSPQGLVYLDIDDRFILSLIPYLRAYNLIRPPYFNLLDGPGGAHVPVIGAREMAFHYLDLVPELNREFSFEIEGLYSVEPTNWPEVEQVWFFKLHSPQLEQVRKRSFLTAKPGGHSFHIAVAVKPRVTAVKKRPPLPTMRINVACLAA